MDDDEKNPVAKFALGDRVDFVWRGELIVPNCEVVEVLGPPLYDVIHISYRLKGLFCSSEAEGLRVKYESDLVLHNQRIERQKSGC
jgi:hypothetical protein